MIVIHVPNRGGTRAATVKLLTEGLDAVVLRDEPCAAFEGALDLTLTGNPRDLRIAAERARHIGGRIKD